MKQIGRNIYQSQENKPKQPIKLSIISIILVAYYKFRIKLIEKHKEKYASFTAGYQYELFSSYVYLKQAYLHRIEARYMKDELLMLKKLSKENEKKSNTPSKIRKVRKKSNE